MYQLIRPLLFLLPPERAHHLTFRLLHLASWIPGLLSLVGARKPEPGMAVEVMGLRFPAPVGLAAGMDKNAEHVVPMSELGFGFIEVGTLTPLPQPGNEAPRLFRLPKDRALINRMGFNNGGVEAAVKRLAKLDGGIIVGGNIGRNKVTSNEKADQDYVKCFDALFPVVDYFVVNVSSPNTPGLRDLQEKGPLLALLKELGAVLDRMESDKLDALWRRVREWQRISSQLSLLAGFLHQDEGFLDLPCHSFSLRGDSLAHRLFF